MTLKERIKAYCTKEGMNYIDFHELLNMSYMTMSNKMLSGKWQPNELIRLQEILGMSDAELLDVIHQEATKLNNQLDGRTYRRRRNIVE